VPKGRLQQQDTPRRGDAKKSFEILRRMSGHLVRERSVWESDGDFFEHAGEFF